MRQPDVSAVAAQSSTQRILVGTKQGLGRFWNRYPTAFIALIVLSTVVLSSALADVIVPFEPVKLYGIRLSEPFTPALNGGTHILGTDALGRDLFTRLLHGGRVSLLVGLFAPTIGLGFGGLVGLTSAYFGGITDLVLQRLTDVLVAIPSLVMAMAITITFGFTPHMVIIAIAVAGSPFASRLLRSHGLVLRETQYVEAARAIGCSNRRIILKYMAPNSWAPWIVLIAVNVGNAIVIESSLSFLGLGIQPPTTSWGNLLIRATKYFTENPHLVMAPGLMITIVVLCTNICGDALRDALDPRLRGAD